MGKVEEKIEDMRKELGKGRRQKGRHKEEKEEEVERTGYGKKEFNIPKKNS